MMSRHVMRRSSVMLRVLGMTALSLLVLWSMSGDFGAAQGLGAGAQALTVAMGPPQKALDRAPYAAVPAAGGSASDSSVQYVIEGLGLVDLPLVTANGSGSGGSGAGATATAWTSGVNLFGGRVRVSSLRVNASASSTAGATSANGDVIVEGLVVDNVPITAVELNHSIPLPGIGTVIAREVQVAPGGAAATANGLRINGDPASGPLAGKQLIVAQAAAGIPSVPLTPPQVAAAPLSAVLQSRPPLDTLIRLRGLDDNDNDSSGDDDDNDNFESDDNDNFESDDNDNFGNDNANATSTPTSGTGTSVATATAATAATQTPTGTPIP